MPMTDSAGEVMQPITTVEALGQAQLQAMRAMSDHIASQGRQLETMVKDMREVRDGMIKLEAQDLKAMITSFRSDLIAADKDLRQDYDRRFIDVWAEIEDARKSISNNKAGIARLGGIIVPIAAFGSAILTFIGELIVNAFTAHH